MSAQHHKPGSSSQSGLSQQQRDRHLQRDQTEQHNVQTDQTQQQQLKQAKEIGVQTIPKQPQERGVQTTPPKKRSVELDNAVYDLMTEESLVNGVWFHLLSQAFPMPKYIIAPEHRNSAGTCRPDLKVFRVKDKKEVFVYEGKREYYETLNFPFTKARDQLVRYLKDMNPGRGSAYSFGVVAVGKKYAVIQYNSERIERRVKRFEDAYNMVTEGVISVTKPGKQHDDLSCQDEYKNVLGILKSIENWISSPKNK